MSTFHSARGSAGRRAVARRSVAWGAVAMVITSGIGALVAAVT